MPHDEHFLRRLDRLSSSNEELELALGLYRDHELVRYVLDNVRLPEGADRVALALGTASDGPHVVVTRDGHFVTCLGAGMKTGAHPVVSRAHLDALAAKVERVRDGIALARKRGLDETKLLEKISAAGPAVSREDFVAAEAVIGPASGILIGAYAEWARTIEESLPILMRPTTNRSAQRMAAAGIARGAWLMGHSALIQIDTASREWIEGWAAMESWSRHSPWTFLFRLSAFPFAARAVWIAARLGKPILPSYRERFAKATDMMEFVEAGWGLVAMGLRHKGLRAEIWRTLQGRKPEASDAPWVTSLSQVFIDITGMLDENKEEELRVEGLNAGRHMVVQYTEHLPSSSPHRYSDPARVGDELALAALLGGWHDVHREEEGAGLLILGVVMASRARAEDFYLPASLLAAVGQPSLEDLGASLIEMRRALVGVSKPVTREPTPGRNDPCFCGSGKKYKKCHGR